MPWRRESGTALPPILLSCAADPLSRTAVAAVLSMTALATGCYGLHLRISTANQAWREEASSIVGVGPEAMMIPPSTSRLAVEHHPEKGIIGQFRMSRRNSAWTDAAMAGGNAKVMNDFDRQMLRRTVLDIPKGGGEEEHLDVDSSQTLVERSAGGRRS